MPPAACKAGAADVAYSVTKFAEARKVCDELQSKLCTAIGPETKSCEMVKKQTPNFPPPSASR